MARIRSNLRDNHLKLWQDLAVATLTDTHRLIQTLTKRGFTPEQAEAITDVIQEVDLSSISTRTDLAQLETRLTVRMATFVGIGVATQSVIIAAIQVFTA